MTVPLHDSERSPDVSKSRILHTVSKQYFEGSMLGQCFSVSGVGGRPLLDSGSAFPEALHVTV